MPVAARKRQHPASSLRKLKGKSRSSSSRRASGEVPSTAPAPSRRRVAASELKWRKVNMPSLPGMDDGGGMMMLEELDGVGIEWENDETGRKVAKFVESDRKGKQRAAEVPDEDGEEAKSTSDNDEKVDEVEVTVDSDAMPSFSAFGAEELDEADDEPVIEAEPEFNDDLLPEWSGVPVHTSLKRAMVALDFVRPTDIQRRSVPPGLDGRDVVGVAETGSGKTLAYSLPILSYILRQPAPRPGHRRPLSALVLCPTRELALQVTEHLSRVLSYALANSDEEDIEDEPVGNGAKKGGPKRPPRVSVGSVVGGLSAQKQKRILDRGCDVLVATPGRLWDMIKTDDQLAAGVRALRFLVIDEADRMIETGHFAELENIVQLTQRSQATADDDVNASDPTFANTATALTETAAREDMQTFVFSATLSKDLQQNLKRRRRPASSKAKSRKATALEDLVEKLDFRDANPEVIDLSPEGGLVASLRESMVECVATDKDLYLYYFLLRYPGRSLVFVGSIDGIRRLLPLFETLQVPVYPLHSQLQQKQRLKNLDRFKASSNGVLIATDVAARGLDIPHVDHVVHFNLPRTADAYVHRSGRTARAKNPGFALQLVCPEDKALQRNLLRSLDRSEPPAELVIEGGFLPKLKERLTVARDIEKAQHMVKKENHDKNWLREAAEAMDIDLDATLLSEDEHDPDAPFHGKKVKGNRDVPALKARLAALLAQPLVARGVSARYPTSGSRIIVDDIVHQTAHPTMLGAPTARAYEQIDTAKLKQEKHEKTKGQGATKRKAPSDEEDGGKGKRSNGGNGGNGGKGGKGGKGSGNGKGKGTKRARS